MKARPIILYLFFEIVIKYKKFCKYLNTITDTRQPTSVGTLFVYESNKKLQIIENFSVLHLAFT